MIDPVKLRAELRADDAWQIGYDDHERGVSETANPYRSGTISHLSWNDGWNAAYMAYAE